LVSHESGRMLLPASGQFGCLIGDDLPPLDIGPVVHAGWLPDQVSPLFQQRGSIGRSGLHGTRRLRHALMQRCRAAGGPGELPCSGRILGCRA
jgi:hypothetical protein